MDDAVLHEELIFSILAFVPVKSLLRFTCVCKRFHTIIMNDPNFAKSHLKASRDLQTLTQHRLFLSTTMDTTLALGEEETLVRALRLPPLPKFDQYRSVECVGSSNGILFLSLDHMFFMWNPTNGFFKVLPELSVPYMKIPFLFGASYLPATDEYKLFIYYSDHPLYLSRGNGIDVVTVFSTKDDKGWKWFRVPEDLFKIENGFCNSNTKWLGTPLKEALHWIIDDIILAVDLSEESIAYCREISLPIFSDEDMKIKRNRSHLEVSSDQRCLRLLQYACNDIRFVTIWEMRDYYNASSWTKLFNFHTLDPPKACFEFGTQNLLLMGNRIYVIGLNPNGWWEEEEKWWLTRIKLDEGTHDTFKFERCPYFIPWEETLIKIG